MLDMVKAFRSAKKKAKINRGGSLPSTPSPSPTPSTTVTNLTPPPLLNIPHTEGEKPESVSTKSTLVETIDSREDTSPAKKRPAVGKVSGKNDVENRTKMHDRTLKSLDPIIDIANIGKSASETAGDLSGPLKATFGVAERVITIVRNAVATDKAWVELLVTLEEHQGVLNHNKKLVDKNKQLSQLTPVDTDLVEALEEYDKVLKQIRQQIEHSDGNFNKKKAKSYFKQPLTAKVQGEIITRLGSDLIRSWDFLQGRINLSVRRTTMRVEEHVARIRISQTLQVAEARGNTIGKLLPGTRTDIIQTIENWADESASGKRIFWLCDGPGTGKSTIAAHMANQWRKKKRYAGGFFFSREDEHTRNLNRLCATVAKQTIELFPAGQRYIIDLRKDPSFLPFTEQFDLLIKGLLNYLAETPKALEGASSNLTLATQHAVTPLVIVIDSLDQCEIQDQTRLLDAILHHLPSLTSARIFITSTPLHDNRHSFHKSTHVLKSEVSRHGSTSGRTDIELYVRDRLKDVLPTYQQDQIIESSNGVFQLAAVSCRILKNAIHKNSALAQLVSMKRDSTFSNLYTTLLETIKEEQFDVEESINAIRTVLQAIVLAYRPVTIATHHAFLPKMEGLIGNYVQSIISWLKGIVKVGGHDDEGPVYILHPTFRVYLLGLPPGEVFNIAAPAGHAFMAAGCLKLLDKLEYDLCGVVHNRDLPLPVSNPLEIPPQVVERFGIDNSTPLRYAVVFWARHAAEGLVDEDIRQSLVPFFQRHLLNWIEWAAMIRELPDCIVGLEHLVNCLESRVGLHAQPMVDISALKWCEDTLRFLNAHKGIINQSSMQTYYSALAFDKPGSLIQGHYRSASPHPLPDVFGQSDIVHPGGVTAVAVSRKGDVIATAGNDLYIRLWDGDTRGSTSIILKGHNEHITSMAFSPHGNLLASGSTSGMLCVWTVDEEWKRAPVVELAESGPEVDCLTFSGDEETIICGYKDGFIGTWSISERRCIASYTIPVLVSPVISGESAHSAQNANSSAAFNHVTSFIVNSRDNGTIALSCGNQLRIFHVDNQNISGFLTIRYGAPAQPIFSQVLSTGSTTASGDYLYWGDWVLDMSIHQRDLHRFISKASQAEAQVSSALDWAGPATRPVSLLYMASQPTRVNSYRMDEDGGVLLLPADMEVSCWTSMGTKIVVGTADGRVVLIEFADWKILGEEGEGFAPEGPGSEVYETASDGTGDGDDGVVTDDFMSAIEGPMSRRGSAAPV